MKSVRRLAAVSGTVLVLLGVTALPAQAVVTKTGTINCPRFEVFEIQAQYSGEGYIYVNDRLIAAASHKTMSSGVFNGGLQSGSWEVEVEGGGLNDAGTFAFCQNFS